MRPGEPPIMETADSLCFKGLFLNSDRYDLSCCRSSKNEFPSRAGNRGYCSSVTSGRHVMQVVKILVDSEKW